MNRNVIIIGASGHGKVIADMVIKNNDRIIGFLDDDPNKTTLMDYPILGPISDIQKYKENDFVIAIGNNAIRKDIAQQYPVHYITLVHPNATIGQHVTIGKGTVIMAGAVINPDTTIGEHCIVNTSAVIEHDNSIGNYTHISPKATLCGTVTIGQNCHIGAGATIINNITISDNVTVGAGSTVLKDIEESGTYVGSPVRKVR